VTAEPQPAPETVPPPDGEATDPASILAHRLDGAPAAPSLLLLNGGFMSIASWKPYAAPLAARFRLLRCDFRGQLLTPGPAHRDLGAVVEDVAALLDHLGLDRVHVLGTSYGGEAGLMLAARHPERVRSLVAVTVADRTTEAMRRGGVELRRVVGGILAGGDAAAFHDLLVGDVYSRAWVAANGTYLAARRRQIAQLPRTWFAALDDLVAAVERFDLAAELPAIRCPTLVVLAGDDGTIPAERGRAVAAAVPGARLVEHPTSGHALVVEEPEWLLEQALGFLAATAAE
jgi:pimeloyl-ACP methyl ester carboxylesterase